MKNLENKTKKISLTDTDNKLSISKMESIEAGKMNWGAFCYGIEAAALLTLGTNPILDAAGVGCFLYGGFVGF
ncbi:hypothetical protein G7A72_06970 [Flavobacterium sp. Sr18]|uniref:hypothetical protein n=1 Tax=Flavobacterium sp. Sr18 TaxID=935222 RepID=UPI0013E4C941|nr:hypothetical protein [Flavobacterium sp. Sr18]QIH38551.1 hypothetical protein G7A72_06970 [Flavobacterium sp. Sr18]